MTKVKFKLPNIFVTGLILFCFVIFGSYPTCVHATTIKAHSDSVTVAPDQKVVVTVEINTEGSKVNTVSGDIIFNYDELEFIEVWSGDSIVPMWIDLPNYDPISKSLIHFSGLIPKGYKGINGKLFSIIFRAKKELGQTNVNVGNVQVFSADQPGAAVQSKGQLLELEISESKGALNTIESIDEVPPKDFTPVVAQGQDLFDGKKFLIFDTDDDASGIERYQILEFREELDLQIDAVDHLPWRDVASPAVLEDQSRQSFIYVRAYDHMGNVRTVMIPPEILLSTNSPYRFIWLFVILVGLMVVRVFFRKRKN